MGVDVDCNNVSCCWRMRLCLLSDSEDFRDGIFNVLAPFSPARYGLPHQKHLARVHSGRYNQIYH